MASPDQKTFFASRRWTSHDGQAKITLICLEDTLRTDADESTLKSHNCGLGEFFRIINGKIEKTNFIKTEVFENVAYVPNLRVKLERINGTPFFVSALLPKAMCRDLKLPNGNYTVTMNSLLAPEQLPLGELVHFEATNVRSLDAPNLNDFPLIDLAIHKNLGDLIGELPAVPVLPAPFGGAKSRPVSRASTAASGDDELVKGVGFQKKKYPNKKPKNNQGVVGKGFPVKKEENQEKKPIVGAGFEVPKKEGNVIVGEGFVANVKSQVLRGVVLTITQNPKNGVNTHFLWILDRQAEGRFVTKEYKLAPGHFFEGTFTQSPNQKWNCEKYGKQVPKPAAIDGGLDYEGKIWFTVHINQFQPAGGNRRFAQATARYFGNVVEGELDGTKLTSSCNGKKVKIQRRGVGEKDYVWMVLEILPTQA
ncbi:hypothetical protein L3Y34_003820 [Caenorhabditis briggsae]|uniref:Uncharacterized protein n=1 Tax=Caenorhabditis briggsae TaxID=6238 RepID=A0AAE9D6E7_CAEBR|nr:hypothetical protein L3Y34_003820 [Caenorhabditis briggsae]